MEKELNEGLFDIKVGLEHRVKYFNKNGYVFDTTRIKNHITNMIKIDHYMEINPTDQIIFNVFSWGKQHDWPWSHSK